jgi:hypothetical protein
LKVSTFHYQEGKCTIRKQMRRIFFLIFFPMDYVAVAIGVLALASCQHRSGKLPTPVSVYCSSDTSANYYMTLRPDSEPKGVLVILPGFSTTPSDFLAETDLPVVAQKDNYLVIIPYLDVNTFYTDSVSQERLRTLLLEVTAGHDILSGNLILGGHSAGGNGALLYTERALSDAAWEAVKPKAVFAVDPPLDMKRLWNMFSWLERIQFNATSSAEAGYFLNRFRTELGGTPYEVPDQYQRISSFYRDAIDGGAVRHLRDTPVRLYCDPDVQWYVNERRIPIELTNISDLSACIVQLRLMGNERAELMANPGRGIRPDGTRHPHAFSQLNPNEFLDWANELTRSSH